MSHTPKISVPLRTKETVRTTFKFTKNHVQLLEELAKKGITKKRLLDEIIVGNQQLEEIFEERSKHGQLNTPPCTIRRTQTISVHSSKRLKELSNQHGISRDAALCAFIEIFAEQLLRNAGPKREKHEKALKIIERHYDKACKVGRELWDLLADEGTDADNPIANRFGYSLVRLENLMVEIKDELENGTPISPWG